MRSIPCLLLILTFALTSLGLASTAVAQGAASQSEVARKVEELSARGAQKYRSQDFEGAIADFEQAYELEPVPNLLYNIAKCHEKIENWTEAIDYYERFVVAPDVETEARQHALAQVRTLRERIGAPDTEVKITEKPEEEKKEEKVIPPQAPPAPDRTLAYASLGTGAALLATGAVFGLMASGSESEFHSATTSAERLEARDSGTTQALIADSLFVTGALVTGVGAYLFFTAKPAEDKPGSAAISPWFSGQGAGVSMSLGF